MANKGVQLKDSGDNLLYPNPYPVGSVYISTVTLQAYAGRAVNLTVEEI